MCCFFIYAKGYGKYKRDNENVIINSGFGKDIRVCEKCGFYVVFLIQKSIINLCIYDE